MIERVARSLADRRVYQGYNAETRARMIEREMYAARQDVRFVLEAVREPTEEMMKGYEVSVAGCQIDNEKNIYRAMIDAALKDEP